MESILKNMREELKSRGLDICEPFPVRSYEDDLSSGHQKRIEGGEERRKRREKERNKIKGEKEEEKKTDEQEEWLFVGMSAGRGVQ